MLSGNHFYHATIKRIVSVFGTLFNNIVVGRHNGNTISNIARVPISYGPRQKFLSRMNIKLDEQKVAIKLPRMSFEITSIDYDTSTKLNRLNTTLTSGDNNSATKRNKMYQSVPYTLGMQLNILARNQEDALQILEQILPTFSPEYTVTVKGIEGPNSKTDVPFILNGVSFSDDYEGDFNGRRTLVYTLDFTVKIRFAPDVANSSIIRKVETEIADFTNVAAGNTIPLSTVSVTQNSPSATINTFVSLINPADVSTVDLVYEDVQVSGIAPLNALRTINIVSGDSPDFDRVENEDFNSIQDDLNVTGGTGTGATIQATIDGLTGITTSVQHLAAGASYTAGDQLTITDSPFHNSNLVVQVDSVDYSPGALESPASDSPFGSITGVSIVSGNSPNTDFLADYSPTFIRGGMGVVATMANNTPSAGSEARIQVRLDKTGRILSAAIEDGGFDYNLEDSLVVSPLQLGETAATFSLQNLIPINDTPSVSSMTSHGFDSEFQATLNGQDGSLSDLQIVFGGEKFAINDEITIAASALGENSPGGPAPSNPLKIRVLDIENSPNTQDSSSPYGIISQVEIISGDSPHLERVGAKSRQYDSPFTNLVLSVGSLNSDVISGKYIRDGKLNDRPKYKLSIPDSPSANDTPTNNNIKIEWNGAQWQLKNGNSILAKHDGNSPAINVPADKWIVLGREEEELSIISTDNQDFTIGEDVTGNISLGSAKIITSNDNIITINEIEQPYVENEILTGSASGITRTVFRVRDE